MRLKLSLGREPKHKDVVTAVGWATGDDLLSTGDDHLLLKWNQFSGDTTTVATLPDNLYPTDIHWFPRGLSGGGVKKAGGGTDLFVLTSADGKYYLISKNGRVEKTVEAHRGAVLSAKWSYDGASLLTVGEDGTVKVWSRSGMLRSTLAQNSGPAYACAWSPDNNRALYCCGRHLNIKPLQANAKSTQWKAHDGIILALDWHASNNLIVTGGEDCKYKVWDSFGRALYSSAKHEFPITSIAWSTEGSLFAVGSFNTLRLCDKAGWSHCLEKPRTGSILKMRWSPDGTQLAGACGNGHVIFANVIEQRVEWRHFEALQTKRKTVEVRNVMDDSKEKLEMKDRVTNMALQWGYLIITTATQCYLYNSKNWNTPTIFDLKEGSVSLVIMSPKIFLLVDGGSVLTYTYDGRQLATLKVQGMRPENLNERTVGLSNDAVAIRDKSDEKIIHLLDPNTGKHAGDGKIIHLQEITEIAIDQCGPAIERRVAFIDKNCDLFLSSVKMYGSGKKMVQIGSMVQTIRFNDTTNMLVGLQDAKILVWCYPSAAYVDKELLHKTILTKESTDLGKSPTLLGYAGNRVQARRTDGSMISTGVSPFPAALHAYVEKAKWDNALRLCRHIKDDKLWATLAAMAAYSKYLNAAEIAYGAIDEAEKVKLLAEIKSVNSKEIRNAEMALFCGNAQEAENLFLQTNVFRAIMLNLTLYHWDRALDLAVKNKIHIDTVLGYRQRYLEEFDRKETKQKYIQHAADVEVDWETIEERVEAEYEKETVK